MFLLIIIINFASLFFNIIHPEPIDVEKTTIIKSKTANKTNVVLIFHTGVLMSFSIYDVVFPVWEKKAGVFVDDYDYQYEAHKNVTNVLLDLKQQGFQIFIISNIFLADDYFLRSRIRGEVLESLPLLKQVGKMFHIFGWKDFLSHFICYQRKIEIPLLSIQEATGLSGINMIYFDIDKKYDKQLRRYGVTRVMAKNGINRELVMNAVTKLHKSSNKRLSY